MGQVERPSSQPPLIRALPDPDAFSDATGRRDPLTIIATMSSHPSLPVAGTAFFNPFPKYLQVRQALERRMYAGFELGQQLPTEKALCEEFGVSRETVREALRGLEDDGIIQRHRAKGTFFVRRPEQITDQKLTGLVEDYAALKLDTHAKVLEAAPLRTGPQLPLLQGSDAPQFRIRRLRYLDSRPLVLHEAFLPTAVGERVAALDLTHASISHLLEKRLRIRFVEERHQIEAVWTASPAAASSTESTACWPGSSRCKRFSRPAQYPAARSIWWPG